MRILWIALFFVLAILCPASELRAQGLSIKTRDKAECDRLCDELVFDCNRGHFSNGWCVIVTSKAPVVDAGLALKTPSQAVCDGVAGSVGEGGRWDKSTTWCVIGEVVSYQRTPNAGIKGHNKRTLHKTSLDDCRAACTATAWCKSFDYKRAESTCFLQDVNRHDVSKGLKTDYPGHPYDHYEKRTR